MRKNILSKIIPYNPARRAARQRLNKYKRENSTKLRQIARQHRHAAIQQDIPGNITEISIPNILRLQWVGETEAINITLDMFENNTWQPFTKPVKNGTFAYMYLELADEISYQLYQAKRNRNK